MTACSANTPGDTFLPPAVAGCALEPGSDSASGDTDDWLGDESAHVPALFAVLQGDGGCEAMPSLTAPPAAV